jgi:hypothetical protein
MNQPTRHGSSAAAASSNKKERRVPIDYTHQHISSDIMQVASPHTPISSTGGGLPSEWVVDAKGNLSIDSGSTPDNGDALLTLHPTGEDVSGGPLMEINSDGQADYYFQDGQVGGPIFFDFWSTDPVGAVVRISTEGLEIGGVVTFQNSHAGGPAIYLSGLPTSDPHSAGQVYSNGVPSAGVPRALMVSGG